MSSPRPPFPQPGMRPDEVTAFNLDEAARFRLELADSFQSDWRGTRCAPTLPPNPGSSAAPALLPQSVTRAGPSQGAPAERV